jgi:phosphatidylserine/phosphatidylglycerophosphate/cardiolipin synthase-like enzyme
VSRVRRIALVVLVVATVGGPATAVPGAVGHATGGQAVTGPAPSPTHASAASAGPNETTGPRIAAVYPNPVARNDRGEFVVLDVPPETRLGRYALTDGDGDLSLPNVTASGRVAVAAVPARVRNLTDLRVVNATGSVALANAGERIRLVRENDTVASARYREAPEGELGRYDDRGALAWEPLGTTDRPVVSATGGSVRAFALPDAPDAAVDLLRGADDRILLAGYTFESRRAARALERASERGVDVRVLLEGQPVDGISRRQARLLDSLVEAGVSVDLLGGPHGRYAYHHAKYAVVDDRAVVLTENWKPSGTGGHSSRGWGATVGQPRVVDGLVETFEADADWKGARPWRQARQGRTFRTTTPGNGSYPSRHDPAQVQVDRTELLVAPDNAGDRVVEALDAATESIDVVQMSVDGPDQRFLRATLRAARRGVDVRILLSSAWYVEEENRRLVERLRERADAEGLPLEAKLASPDGAFEKIHAKGAVVDGETVLLGSLNWNDDSIRKNREVMLLLHGDEVGSYYRSVFESDWGGADEEFPLPLGIIAAIGGCVVLAALVARRIEFGENVGVGP